MNEPVTVSTLILILYFFLYPEGLAGIFYLALFLLYGAIKLFFLILISPVGIWVLLIGSYFLIGHRAPVYIACAYGAVVLAMIIHEAITGAMKKEPESQNESAS